MAAGLEGVIAARTRLSHVDGQEGKLVLAGYSMEDIAPVASFEEVVYLLWNDELPDETCLSAFRAELAAERPLSQETLSVLSLAAERDMSPMDALRLGTETLAFAEKTADSKRDALRVVAQFPTMVAAYWRLKNGETPVSPDPNLSHTANYLYMLFGETPESHRIRALETYLNAVVDHGLNASTFAARVIISTHSDMISAIVGALGALKGPRHGGVPGPVLDMLLEICETSRAETYLKGILERGERIMGFGHRVYKVRDPRAAILSEAAASFYDADDPNSLYRLAEHVERTAIRLLNEHRPGRNLQTNVEFATALLLRGVGLSTELFTPTFAVSRVAGWTAHALEELAEGRLIRPLSEYVGREGRKMGR